MTDPLEKYLVGYCDPLSVRAGGAVRFKASADRPGTVRAQIVELICGDDRPHGSGFLERLHEDLGDVHVPSQPLITGSYGVANGLPAISQYQLSIWVFPTRFGEAPQTVLNLAGTSLTVDASGFAFGPVRLPFAPTLRRWHKVTVEADQRTKLTVTRQGFGTGEPESTSHSTSHPQGTALEAGTWHIACKAPGQAHFNGRLEAPLFETAAGPDWHFDENVSGNVVQDHSSCGAHLTLHQTPTRAVRGHNWVGTTQRFAEAPSQYAAIHFHEDDLTDAGWTDVLEWHVPADTKSGQYACKLTQGNSEDYIPFFVRPAAGARQNTVAYLVPTATYLAYANQRLGFTGGIFGEPKLHHANEKYLYEHEDVGYSLYEYHRDRSGVHFSSRLRPILNLKPKNQTWAFNADTHVTAWLHAIDQPFDVITDEDLHLEGTEALSGYRVLITGSHPEYYSTAMWDGLSGWLDQGGRLMYMGGNGFYWRIAYDPHNPAIIEVRRAEDGTRAWISEPGEYYHQFTGEYGGLWRRLGRAPNALVGIGFAAQGFDGGTYYRIAPGALDPRVGFAVANLREGETFGAYGVQGGGAAGEEIDRWDAQLGSPPHAVVIATSEAHKPGMLRVKEEYHMTEPPRRDDPNVRADMVFFETPAGGAVFSTGSISYTGSLCHNSYDNDIATLAGNVLRRFDDPAPFQHPETTSNQA